MTPCTNIPEITEANAKKRFAFHPKRMLKSFQQRLYTSDYLYLLFCFLAPAAIAYAIYLIIWTGFVGGGTPLVLDLNAQYVYFFEALRKFVYGDASLLYSFCRTLGGEFMGIYAYYIASPLSYIVALFPEQYMQEALTFIFILKAGLCGLTFGFYLHKRSSTPNKLAIFIFSMLYALCSYAVVHQSNTMWIDALIWLPIFTYALENLITRRKFKLYVISLAAILMSNYYIGYMVCIFAVLYFFYYYFSKSPTERNPRGERLHFIRTGSRFALFSILAAAISAFILVAAYYSLTFGKSDFSNPSWAFTSNFDVFDFLVKLLPGAYDTVDYPGLPFVYCGVLTLILIPVYFTAKKIALREKLASAALIAIFLISFIINPIDLIWHGFSQPNWLNGRYSFMFCFFLLVLAYKAFGNLKKSSDKFILVVCGLLLIIAAVAEKLELESFVNVEKTFRFNSLSIDGHLLWTIGTVWFAVVFIALIGALLCSRIRINVKKTRNCVTSVLAAVVAFELLLNGVVCILWFDEDVHFSRYDSYYDRAQVLRPVIEQLEELDDGFYRAEKTSHRTVNENMALGLKGISSSTSTLNADAIEFLRKLGYTSGSHRSQYLGGTPFADSLLGIKYVIDDKKSNTYHSSVYNAVEGIKSDMFTVYQNPNALSLAYGVSSGLKEFKLADKDGDDIHPTFFDRYNSLLAAMLGEKNSISLFNSVNHYDIVAMGCEETSISMESRTFTTEKDDSGKIAFRYEAPYTGDYYFYAPTRESYPPAMELEFNNTYIGEYMGNDTKHIFYVGHFEEGETIDIFISIPEDSKVTFTAYFKYLWYVNDEIYDSSMERLTSGPQLEIDKTSTDDKLTGKITTASADQMILTTIPYDEGWKIFVDGEQVKIYEALDSLIAFDIKDSGKHTILMKYSPDCYRLGAVISIAGIGIFLLLIAAEFVLKRTLFKNALPVTYANEQWLLEDFDGEADICICQCESVAEPPEATREEESLLTTPQQPTDTMDESQDNS